MLKLGSIGGLGLMAAPAAKHLRGDDSAVIVRVHDRGRSDARRDAIRRDWRDYGAELVGTIPALVGEGDLDAVLICAGKNGDDCAVVGEVARLLARSKKESFRPTIIHMSTVSTGFVRAASTFCESQSVHYVNYPLTGGPKGAELGGAHPNGMLILAAGDETVFGRFEPMLRRLGHPRYFGAQVDAGAVVKLIGQHMVFNGCTGISSAAGILAASFHGGELSGEEQADFFQFLNGGAGGTRQWDVALSKGVRDGVWDQGFMIKHAVVDAIYAAQLALDLGMPRFSIYPMIHIALAFSFLLEKSRGAELATHAIAKELNRSDAAAMDSFFEHHRGATTQQAIEACIRSLPDSVRRTVGLNVGPGDF
ncbi:MAG: NAD(P)-binding domain-containing protein [Bdellovibrionota bacterium]